MADVEFEPLHGENEEDGEFMLERQKKESSAKKHRQKTGQLFQRKSVEKKDKTLVIDNSKALAASPSKSSAHFMHHHHHSRQVEGLVGPGDIQFGSSPPGADDIMPSNLSQSTGCIPQTVNQNQSAAWQRLPQLPLRPPQHQWTQVENPPQAGMFPLQRRTLSQEKLTLLEKAKGMTPTSSHNSGVHEGFSTPEKTDNRRGFQAPPLNAPSEAQTPPRVASPTEKGPFSPPSQQPLNSPAERRIERSESWDPSLHQEHGQREENWADFSKSFDSSELLEEEQTPRRRQSQVSTISEGSEGSYVSEIEENDWRITDEQRIYYLAQFKKMQPNENGLIKGPQARDFFLKSNLPVEVLSKIWHLSDMNKDSALDLEEFCIAMHLVVAVKHDVELPSVLPTTLMPAQDRNAFEASYLEQAKAKAQQQQQLSRDDGSADDERPSSPPQISPKDQYWAKFEENASKKDASRDGQNEEVRRQDKAMDASIAAEQSMPATSRTQSLVAKDDDNTNSDNIVMNQREISDENKKIKTDWHHIPESNAAKTNSNKPQGFQNMQQTEPMNSRPDTVDSPMPKEPLAKKSSIGIARPRGMGATINLIDTMPGQLLPPPDGKKSRKIMQQQNFSQGLSSPPLSPTARVSSDLTSDSRNKSESTEHSYRIESKMTDLNIANHDLDSTDGFNPPTLTPRDEHVTGTDQSEATDVVRETGDVVEAVLRRGSSSRRSGRPRSYTADSRSSRESLVDGIPARESKDFEVPPTPPPRKVRTHKRGSSLDLSKLFGSKSQQNVDNFGNSSVENTKFESMPSRVPSGEKTGDKKDRKTDIHIIARPRPAPQHHNRSTSCDSAQAIAPPPKTSEGIIKDSRPPGYRKKPAPPKPSAATRAGRSKSLERTFENSQNEETIVVDHKPRNLKRPLRKKRQRQEIQAGIRVLRDKNSSIASLNGELQQELKEAMETRTKLEIQLTKLKQLPE